MGTIRRLLPSRLLPADPSSTRHASWLELFFDLVFVANVAQLTHYLLKHHTLLDWGIALMLFIPVRQIWTVHTAYATRYDMNRPAGRGVTTVFMACAALYAVGVHEGLHGNMLLIIIPFLVARLTWWHMYNWANGWEPRDRSGMDFVTEAAGYLEIGLWIASAFLEQPVQQYVWIVAIIIPHFMGYVLMLRTKVLVKDTHREHGPERQGLFVIIAMGESVIALVAGLAGTTWDLAAVVAAGGGFALLVTLWWLYFDMLEVHVSGSERLGMGMLFSDLHLPILMGLMTFAAGIGSAVTGHSEAGTFGLITGGLALFIVAAHVVGHLADSRPAAERLLLVAILAVLAAGYVWGPTLGVVATFAGLTFAVVVYTAWVRRLDPPVRGVLSRA